MAASLLRTSCRCTCYNSCASVFCYKSSPLQYGLCQYCGIDCLVPSLYYVRFDGITIPDACYSEVSESRGTGLKTVGLSFDDVDYKLIQSQCKWNNFLDDPYQTPPLSYSGYVEYRYDWPPEGYAETCIANPNGGQGYSKVYYGRGWQTHNGFYITLERKAGGWQLDLLGEIYSCVDFSSCVLGKPKVFSGFLADTDAESCLKTMVIPNSFAIGNIGKSSCDTYSNCTYTLGYGGSAIITPCTPEVGI